MRLAGKTASVTGAGSGIGRATALLFAREGARVVVAARRAEQGTAVVDEIAQAGGEAFFCPVDVRRREDNERMINACVDRYGKLDILYCNAGVNLPKLITDSSDEEMEQLLAVNVKALV